MSSSRDRDPSKWSTRILKGHIKRVCCVAWSCDGKRLASGSDDTTIRVWQPERAEYRNSTKLEGHTATVTAVCWDPCNPERLASVSIDRTLRIWDIRLGKATHTYTNPEGGLLGHYINMSWSPDGQYLCVGDKGDRLRILDATEAKSISTYSAPQEANEMVFSNSSDLLFLPIHGSIGVFSVPAFQPLFTVRAHQAPVHSIDADPYGKYLALGSHDAVASLWDLEEWACVRTYSKMDQGIRKVSFSCDGEVLAVTAEENIGLFAVESGRLLHTVRSPTALVATWHPFKKILAWIDAEEFSVKVFGV